ncbi:aldehyde dehydrogenase [Amycolatopsis acidicola]|uniref:aldehyde dehydrogenase (NAD(+)) n=1 Tax=Amycolatopsis acidicola TaxID=2596893 RepID=A0A5N0VCB1_9PSEU|nr:aldehyde dehydrogenase family protein [Amycolatopsis acidicola]KAA9164016.1 aldehyde dehydrogenase [Amycolatopsis acidicola]
MSTSQVVSRSPQKPDDVVFSVPASEPSAVAGAVAEARQAQADWFALGTAGRSAALCAAADELSRRAEEFATLIAREVGKPLGEATGEVARGVSILRYYSQQVFDPAGETYEAPAGALSFTRRRPLGVAGLITPWNFPLAILLWKAAPALAAGNSVVLKPSGDAIGVADALRELLGGHLPKSVFSLVFGGRPVAESLIDAADVVSFTGSTAVGQSVVARATAAGVPVQAEMGGQNPAIVLPDADPDETASVLLGAIAGYAGQKCTATRRVIIVGDSSQHVAALEKAVAAANPADPVTGGTAVGPVINEAAQAEFLGAVREAEEAGAVITSSPKGSDEGYYVPVTVARKLPREHRLLRDEVFGPLATIVEVDTVDEAIAAANDVKYGLVGSVHGRDVEALLRVASRLEAGMVRINAATTGVDFWMPFGGDKDSSFGPREQGKAAFGFYTKTQTVSLAGGSPRW